MSVDNPYYFYNENSPKIPEPPSSASSSSSSKGFSFFRRRSSSSSSGKSTKSQKSKTFNSSTLDSSASALGHCRNGSGSLKSLLRPVNLNKSFSISTGIAINNNDHCNGYSIERRNDLNRNRIRLGSYNESHAYSESDDVFMKSPRNLFHSNSYSDSSNGTITSGLRRHSIGTFSSKDRLRCGPISDEVPKSKAPKPPGPSISRTRTERKIGDLSGAMDDILIVTSRHSEPAILWANYLRTRFDKITKQRGRQPFNFLHIKIDEGPITSDLSKRCQSTKLQIVILCPAFVSLSSNFLMSKLSVILKPDIVLGILLDVPEDKILEVHRNGLPSFKKWRRCVVRNQDQSFVGNVLGIATDILGRALCQRPLCSDTTIMNNNNNSKCYQNDAFTILPRKVKIGQSKVVALLNEPLLKDDWIKIKIEKTSEVIDVVNFKKRNPYTLQFSIPESCMEVSTMIEIKIEKNEKELGRRPIKCESRLRELEQILKSQDSPLEFMCHSLGINMTDRNHLDTYLYQSFQKNIPPNFHLVSGSPTTKDNGFLIHKENSAEEYPTLLHFAGKWGLERFCMQLLECPGGDRASDIRNCNGKTPADLAESNGFSKLANSLRSFSQMNEFTTMYHYFKGISDTAASVTTKVIIEHKSSESSKCSTLPKSQSGTFSPQEYMEMSGSDQDSNGPINAVTNLNYINIENESKEDEMNKNLDDFKSTDEPDGIISNELKILEPAYYDSNAINTINSGNAADAFSQECSNVLENCSNSLNSSENSQSNSSIIGGDYLMQPSNIPVTEMNMTQPNTSSNGSNFSDYLTHPSNKPVKMAENNSLSDYLIQPSNRKVENENDSESHVKMHFKKKDDSKSKCGSLRRQGSDSSKTSVDDELLEIMNDFKNNVFTIQEVEQLVVSWKNRNDVQQSYKDKQEQLQKLRTQYERIQDQMKEKMKRPTPFERVKKLFSRSKSVGKEHDNVIDEPKSSAHRPISSLSLHSISSSSSSSGRMSTGSVCSGASLGDSGTHSDHEDRKHIFSGNCRIGQPGSLMDNYLIPPIPRPITNNGEHYVMFPSNIPVYTNADNSNNQLLHDYMNFSPLNTIEETKETGLDQVTIGPTVQPIKVQKADISYNSSPPSVNSKSDLCSSFKPQPTAKTPSPIAINGDHQTVHFSNTNGTENPTANNDHYKNIHDIDQKTRENIEKLAKTITECNSSIRKPLTISNSKCIDKTDSSNNNHEYMNV